ncbi:phage NrS-1 polymerase family protein [Acinetobacter baumannii]|uniref:phage NrS-1 polymerase family protein n=1 Tax=Acinetobacter baumannii TaxID=470 RepID=UPI0002BC5C66|nr:AAA family ATPase [Acinetobacter baumannii]
MNSLNRTPILPQQTTQGSQAPQQTYIINNSNLWANIPEELKERAQWVVADKNKTPYQCNGCKASPTDPSTWTDFNTACAYAKQHLFNIGYVLSANDPFTCIDLDIKADTPQEQCDRASSIIKTLNSYTEYSQSGKGFHIWVYGNIGKGLRRDNVEIYSQERFIICTGNTLKSEPIKYKKDILDNMVSQLQDEKGKFEPLPDQPQIESDDSIMEKAWNAGNKEKFQALWFAELDTNLQAIGLDHSQADLSLIQMLAFYTNNNDQLIRLWHKSNLGKRIKANRKDYIKSTIRKARQNQAHDEYEANIGKKIADNLLARYNAQKPIGINKFIPTNLLDVMNRPPMEWFVQGVLPKKGLATIYGLPATGKSFLMLDLLFAICKGEEWFGMKTKQSKVAYINLEDIHGMGNRLHAYQERKGLIPDNDFLYYEISLNFKEKDHVEELINSIKEYAPNCGLVCIDTLAQSANGIDENSSTDMGMVIGKLKKLSSELNCLVLIVHHSGKIQGSGMRGHSSLLGAVDCAIEISSNGSTKKWNIAKSKNGANDIERQFHLEPIPLGMDEDGNPISSAVVTPVIDIQAMNNHNKILEDQNEDVNKDKCILQVIHENPASLQKDWAVLLAFSPDKMSRKKNSLIEKGYLTENGKTVTLTPKGLDLIKI